MKVSIEVPNEAVTGALDIACVDYWQDERFPEGPPYPTKAQLKAGLPLMAKGNPHQFSLLINQNYDAWTGDVLYQYSLLGEEIYG